jgi:ureidoglycolate hydrolase
MNMDGKIIEIIEYVGEGYKPLVDYESWRVAILRFLDELLPERIDKLERHTATDEVFVLLHGQCILLLGGNAERVDAISNQPMESGRIYNIKRNTWHGVLLSRDASVLIVENRDTSQLNSEYIRLTVEQQHILQDIARTVGVG